MVSGGRRQRERAGRRAVRRARGVEGNNAGVRRRRRACDANCMPSHCCTASGFDGNHRKAPPSFWTAASTAPDGSHPTKIVVALAGSCTRYTVWPSSLSTLSICDESTSAIIRARAFHAQCTAPPAPAGTSVSKPLTGTDASSDSLGRRSGAGPLADDSITPTPPDDDCDVGGGGVGAASNADMKSGSSLPPLFREREPPFPDMRLPASCGEPETRRDRFPARARAKRLLYCDARSVGEPSPETSILRKEGARGGFAARSDGWISQLAAGFLTCSRSVRAPPGARKNSTTS